jgi:PAS domain S-box-containing protein
MAETISLIKETYTESMIDSNTSSDVAEEIKKPEDPRISQICEVLVAYATSDFSCRLPLSGKGDGLDAIIAGLNTLAEQMPVPAAHDPAKRLDEILNTLVRYSQLDFSTKPQISSEGDELDAIIYGLNILAEEIQASGKVIQAYERRVNNLVDVLLKYTLLDFTVKAEISEAGDELDAISVGLNTMAEELDAAKIQEEENIRVLKESEERFRLIVEHVKDYAIFMIDPKGYIMSWNRGAQHIKGYTAEEAIGKHFSIFYTPEELADNEPERNLRMAAQLGRYESEGFRQRKNGSRFVADVVITSLYDGEGKLRGFSKITRDITERRRFEREVIELNQNLELSIKKQEEVNKELEAFSYSVSHDLRTPLRAIHSYSRILSTEYTARLEPEALEMMEAVMSNAKRMGQLIDDLLAFSRIGRKDIQKSEIDMTGLVEIVLHEMKELHLDDNIRFIFKELDPAWGDYSMVKQIFINLISNAIKYSSKKAEPEIEIGSENTDGQVVYFIKDNGAGFDMRYYNKLFGVFQRLHDTSEFEGNGVGLALVKRIVSRHGGNIWAEGKPGEGAVFYFSFPGKGMM